MIEGEVYQHHAFSEERQERSHPASIAVNFEPHAVPKTIKDTILNIYADASEVFIKGERNIMWLEEGGIGNELQRMFDVGREKTGSIDGAYAFTYFAVSEGRNILTSPLTDEELENLRGKEFGEFSQNFIMDTVLAYAGEDSYILAQILAASLLEQKGFGVEVVFENSDREPEPEKATDIEGAKAYVKHQQLREERILSQWKDILSQATPETPINLLVHIGSMHHDMAEKIHALNADALTVYFESPDFPSDPFRMELVNKLRRGEDFTETDFEDAGNTIH